jgi:hypothetical protein
MLSTNDQIQTDRHHDPGRPVGQFVQRTTRGKDRATGQMCRAEQTQEPVIATSVPRWWRVVGVRLGHALEQVTGHVGQVRKLFELALHVADQGFWADAFTHPALKERLRGVPQIEVRVQLTAQAFDVQQGLLQQNELRLHFHVEAARGLEQARKRCGSPLRIR